MANNTQIPTYSPTYSPAIRKNYAKYYDETLNTQILIEKIDKLLAILESKNSIILTGKNVIEEYNKLILK